MRICVQAPVRQRLAVETASFSVLTASVSTSDAGVTDTRTAAMHQTNSNAVSNIGNRHALCSCRQ